MMLLLAAYIGLQQFGLFVGHNPQLSYRCRYYNGLLFVKEDKLDEFFEEM